MLPYIYNLNNLTLIGALTIKPYSFKARSWELNYINSIDFYDSVGSNIKLEIRGKKLLRILPRQNDHLNENWITDKARFAFDSIYNQRLGSFYKKKLGTDNKFVLTNSGITSSSINLELIFARFLKKHGKWVINFVGIMDPYMGVDQLLFFKDWLNFWGSSNLIIPANYNTNLDLTYRSMYLFKNTLASLANYDLFILTNINLRLENPIINLKLRNLYLKKKTVFWSFGRQSNPNFLSKLIGVSTNAFVQFLEGKHLFSKDLFLFKNPIFLLGNSLVYRKDFSIFLFLLENLKLKINYINYQIIYNNLQSINAFEIGFYSKNNIDLNSNKSPYSYNIVYNINNLNLNINQLEFNNIKSFTEWASTSINIYHGSFGSNNLIKYNYLLPLSVLLEASGNFLNINGSLINVPNVLTTYKESKDFYSLYMLYIKFLSKINYFSKIIKLNNRKFNYTFFDNKFTRLDNLYTFKKLLNTNNHLSINNYYKFGLMHKSLFNIYQDNFYVSDLYTSYSNLMIKMMKVYNNTINRNY